MKMNRSNLDKNINDFAQERFKFFKSKYKLDLIAPKLDEIAKRDLGVENPNIQRDAAVIAPTLTEEKFRLLQTKVAKVATPEETKEIRENIEFVDDSIEFINSLELSPNLALALGYLLSAHKKHNRGELLQAVKIIETEADLWLDQKRFQEG